MKRNISLLVMAVMLLTLLPVMPVTKADALTGDTYEVSDYTDSAPQKDGYVFAGWYTDDTFATHYTAASGTATAKFVPKEVFGVKYQIRTDTDSGSENTRMRIVTTVDSLDYKSVGFIVQYEGEAARKLQTKTVYRRLIGFDGVEAYTYYPDEAFHSDSKYFCAYNFTVPKAKFGTGFTVTPIIETIDGTEVESTSRTIRVSDYPTFAAEAKISGYKLEGTWITDRVTTGVSASLAPDKIYDGNMTTGWNPQATDYNSGEGIIFRLDRSYDLSKAKLTFKGRLFLFDLYTSCDGENWTQKASVTNANSGSYYTSSTSGSDTYYTCAISGLNTDDAGYVKISFTGSNPLSLYMTFCETEFYGKTETLSTSGLVAGNVGIVGNEILGTWTTPRTNGNGDVGSANTYDGNISTRWNPESKSKYTAGEGIAYTLAKSSTISGAAVTFSNQRYYYFDLQVSEDGTNWTLARSVSAANYSDFYTTADSNYVCAIDDLNVPAARYIRILFTGSSANATDEWMSFYEFAVTSWVEPDTRPVVSATIIDGQRSGSWHATNGQNETYIYRTYDGDASTNWNPCAGTANYGGSPSVTYTLNGVYNLTGANLNFGTGANPTMYFDLYVSSDGENFTQVASVTAANSDAYYPTAAGICEISDLDTTDARYVKITFTGRVGSNSLWINFFEISLSGKAATDTRSEVPAAITAHEQSGSWSNAGATNKEADKSYDGDASTPWNAACTKDSSTLVYTLDNTYNLTGMTFLFDRATITFDVYVSGDGAAWIKAASVTGENYNGNSCELTGLYTADAGYVKVVFTSANGSWFNLYEVTLTGKKS